MDGIGRKVNINLFRYLIDCINTEDYEKKESFWHKNKISYDKKTKSQEKNICSRAEGYRW
jgi:hypothetical protein